MGVAGAAITPASVLAGPSSSVLDVDGAALAADGTGGVVFRELLEGEPHVFVARFLNGVWQPPQQVDVGQPGPATFPTIAAADGGELLVVWVQPWMWISASPGAQATLHYELMSAVLQPGAGGFSQIERIADVGKGTGEYPSLAMAPDGTAYVAYRGSTGEVRVSRFNGRSWSSLGVIDRQSGQVALRTPSASNAPVVAVNDEGQALVVWQEPESAGVARIWARRLFGTTLGSVLAVSPSSIDGAPVSVDADGPAVALGAFGQAAVAFRLQGGAGSPLGAPHIFVSALPEPLTEQISSFSAAVPIDGASTIGTPSVAVDSYGQFRVAYVAAGATRLLAGDEGAGGAPQREGPPLVLGQASAEPAFASIAPDGGGTTAWPAVAPNGLPAVAVREDFPGGGAQDAFLSAPLSGPVADLVAGESYGNMLLAFRQGSAEAGQVMAAYAQTPPERFRVETPSGWVRPAAARVSWEAAPDAIGGVTYSVLVDGRVQARGLSGRSATLDPRALGDGVRSIQVLASDGLGQQTLSDVASLHVESNPPQVSVRHLSGARVSVRVFGDPAGVRQADTLVAFGDGEAASARDEVVHAYRRPGRYTIVVHAIDAVGNRTDARVRVQIP